MKGRVFRHHRCYNNARKLKENQYGNNHREQNGHKSCMVTASYHGFACHIIYRRSVPVQYRRLSGAMLTVIDKDGNVVDRWTSVADEAHVIKRLAAGETYMLRLVRELAMVQCQYEIYQK